MQYFFVYILKCKDNSYYIGHTDNIDLRISQHNNGKVSGYTSTRLPVLCVFVQTFNSRAEALGAECKIKKWTREKKEALIKGDWNEISILSKKKFNQLNN